MKKVGIVTMVGGANYGNALQNYAVQTLIEQCGYEAVTLNNTTRRGHLHGQAKDLQLYRKLAPSYIARYRRTKLNQQYGCKNDRDCRGKGFQLAKATSEEYRCAVERRMERFAQFREEMLHFSDFIISDEKYNKDDLLDFYAFVCGSDQVWNPNFNSTSMVDFLQFAPRENRIAFVPSIGISELPEYCKKDYKAWISEIPSLSVREDAGAEIIRELTGREAKVLLDPTFGLTKEQWLAFAKEPQTHPAQEYVFCYFLGNETNHYVKYIEAYAKNNNCKIVNICDIYDLQYYDIEPREFVWLLAHAKAVFTDSFHGVAFSINLEKPFVVFERVEGGASMSSRITSVLKKTGLEARQYPLAANVSVGTVSFEKSRAAIMRERQSMQAYLHDALQAVSDSDAPKLANHYHCTGCGACKNACKAGALELCADEEGFCYPKIDAAKCIHCNACERACPADAVVPAEEQTKAYYAVAKDDGICRNSSSGGMFSLLAAHILQQGGTVFGAGFDKNFKVCHQRIDSMEDIAGLRTSKYVQSDIGLTFREAEIALKDEKTVLFAGTPCQIAALKQYLKKDYVNLYTQDIICHGVPSPGIWQKYLQEIHSGKEIQTISFRDKTAGWNDFSMKVSYQDGTAYRELAVKDPFESAFLANLILRPSCYQCQYKTVERVSDITLADYWGVETVHPELKDQQGVSLVLTHTPKGEALMNAVREAATVHETDLDRATKMNHATTHSVMWHRNREYFFENAVSQPLTPLIRKCLKPTTEEAVKRFVIRNGSRVKRLLRKMKGR